MGACSCVWLCVRVRVLLAWRPSCSLRLRLPTPRPPTPPLHPPSLNQVAALQTEAVLDVLTDEWVIHTPDEGAIKW